MKHAAFESDHPASGFPPRSVLRGVLRNRARASDRNQVPCPALCADMHASGAGLMPSKLEDYRARAAQCERMAERNRDPTLRAQYLDLAQQRRDLAEQVDQDEARKPVDK
jgi:hypothetical protein